MITKGTPVSITTDELKDFLANIDDEEWYETNYDAIISTDAKLICEALRLAYTRGKRDGITKAISTLL